MKNMIICIDGCYAYSGSTAAEAFSAYINAGDDHNNLSPSELKWYRAKEMMLTMTLAEEPKEKTKTRTDKTTAKK